MVIRIGDLKGVDHDAVGPRQDLSVENLNALPAITPAIFEKIPGVKSLWVMTEYSHDSQLAVEI